MTRKEGTVLAGRAVALFLTVSTLSEITYLPEQVQSFLRYFGSDFTISGANHLSHYYFTRLTFLITRIVGFALMARWIYKGGADVEELLLPSGVE